MPSPKGSALVAKGVQPPPPAVTKFSPEVMAGLVIKGDLSGLSMEQKTTYYVAMANACGLNPATRPFEFLELNGKMVLYVKKEATDQIRLLQKISIKVVKSDIVGELYVVQVQASTKDGREDFATGAVNYSGKRWNKKSGEYAEAEADDLANAIMKAETKAKRRATLSICGLGALDESELDTVPRAVKMIDAETLERVKQLALAKPDLVQVNLDDMKVKRVEDLNIEQAGSIIGLLED